MKNKFSRAWKASKQPRKQRKYLANAPLHLRKKFLSVNLSKELRKKLNRRNETLKKGDTVRIMRGKFSGKTGKVLEVKYKLNKIYIEGMNKKKRDGSNVNVPFKNSKLQIVEMVDRKIKPTKEKIVKEESKEKIKENKK